jgi:hypothetical protein
MNLNIRKSLLSIAVCFGIVVIACNTQILCQTSATSAVITDVEANRYIGLRIEVRAKDAPMVLPTCGSDTESDEHHVCGLASHLQVRTDKGWRPVSVRKGLAGVLGGIAKDKWAPLLIAQGDTAYFTLTIDPSFLDVRTGDQLRVELDTWPNEAAMRITEPEKKLTSPTFICP